MKKHVIYRISSIINPKKFYIGSAIDFENRKSSHLSQLSKNKHANKRLQNHINKYGLNDLNFSIIEHISFKDLLILREQYYIDSLKPWFKICPKAGSQLGYKHTDETKEKLCKARKNRIIYASTILKCIENSKDSKMLINLETGIFYNSMQEAADSCKYDRSEISRMVNGLKKNKTSFAYVSERDREIFTPNIKIRKKNKKHFGVKTYYDIYLNTQTGIYYYGAQEASESTQNIKAQNIRRYISGKIKNNKCNFIKTL